MSAFRNIRVFPKHGDQSARITWQLAQGYSAGDVYLAFSETGVKGSWKQIEDVVAASATGYIDDPSLVVTASNIVGYYRLLLRNVEGDFKSEPIAIAGDISAKEFGMVRAIMYREFAEMRATNGYPVWLCIPRDFGTLSDNYDPDTDSPAGIECSDVAPEDASYGMKYKGGFFEPILTWIRPITIDRGTIKDPDDGTTPELTDVTTIRMMAFPSPARGYMIVDPSTDRRYFLKDEIKPFLLRGIMPIAYEASMELITHGSEQYRFPVPDLDMKAYRKLKHWW